MQQVAYDFILAFYFADREYYLADREYYLADSDLAERYKYNQTGLCGYMLLHEVS